MAVTGNVGALGFATFLVSITPFSIASLSASDLASYDSPQVMFSAANNLVSEPLDRHEVVTRTALGAIQGLDQIPHTRPRLFAVRNTIALRVMPLPLRCQRLNLRAGYESNSNFPHFGIPTLAGRITALLTVVLL